MLEAAAAAGTELDLVGVTVLTSHEPAAYARATGRKEVDLPTEVVRLALASAEAGLQGVVSSPHEVSLLRRHLGAGLCIVVPGMRRRTDPAADQARVATAKDAASNGATHLVVGRPVLQSTHPAAAFEEFMREAQCTGS
jgi:orotidine-5'-phosphate decarboxylase